MAQPRSYICSSDAQYGAIHRELASLPPDEISVMVAAKLRRVLLNQSPPKALVDADDATKHAAMPLLVTATSLAKLTDECALHSMNIDFRNLMSHTSAATEADEERFTWRCTLCGGSLLHKPVYSCVAAMRLRDDQPLQRFHHFCSDCNHVLQNSRTSSARSSNVACPRCNRSVPAERNVVAEAAMAHVAAMA